MFASAIPHRLSILTLFVALLLPASALAFDENRCLDQAVRDRTDDLEDAYSAYNQLFERLLDRFDSVERNAYKETENYRYRNGTIYQSQYTYSSQLSEANRNLNARVQQIWNDYAAKIALCQGTESYGGDYWQNRSYTYPYNRYETSSSSYYNTNYRYTPYEAYQPRSSYYGSSYRYPQKHYKSYPYTQYPYHYGICKPPVLDPYCGYICTAGRDGCYTCRQQFCY